jgi:hypothetical protein
MKAEESINICDEESEPMYDVEQLDYFKEMEPVDLIVKLLGYTKTLEEMVIDLRVQVNRLTPKNEPLPYEDLHSDVYEVFDDHPAYERYKEHIELFYPESESEL